jgi:hypothetical protein
MKFALAFAALASAANNEAPVISLNLAVKKYAAASTIGTHAASSHRTYSGHGNTNHVNSASQNSFADECAVKQNGGSCAEPVATAFDHHDGIITAKVKTTYRLFVESNVKSNPEKKDSAKTGINLSQRGEWIIEYNVKDDDGNAAESVTFALILTDEIKPGAPTTTGDLTFELCKDETYTAIPQQTATDLYDGKLTEANSIMDVRIYKAATEVTDHVVPRTLYNGLSSALELTYKIESFDFADIFGASNENNVRLTEGKITMKDTTVPTIKPPTATQWECGYQPAKSGYRFPTKSAYSDCYDDWANTKTDVRIGITGMYKNSAEGGYKTYTNKPIDGGKFGSAYTAEAKAIFGSESVGSGGEETAWVSHSKPQTLTLTYTAADNFGNNAVTIKPTISLVDTIAPTLYITKKIATAGTHTVNGDECDGVAAKYSNGQMGDYTHAHCKFTVKDGHSKYSHSTTATSSATNSVVYHVNDPMAAETEIQHSAGYAEDYKFVQELMVENTGYACYDACSTTTTTVEWKAAGCGASAGTEFNMLKPGTYWLKYTCKDEADLSTTACRTFINVDKTRPVITILEAANHNDGTWHVEASRDNNYVDAGATCSDMVDGNISQDVEVSGDVVNMAAVGTYKINYNCEDSAGQTAFPATRTVIVEDKTCPTCKIPGGDAVITVEASFPYTEEASTCTDTLDGAMPDASIYGTVDVELTGTYVLTYSVTDKNGNGADPAQCSGVNENHRSGSHFTKTVVVEDTMVPIISLQYKGSKLMAESTTSTVNGWVIGAVASAVSGVALLGYAATRKATVATSVPV